MHKALGRITLMIALLSLPFSAVSVAGNPELVDGLKCEAFGLTVKRPATFYLKADRLDKCHSTLPRLTRDDMPTQSQVSGWWTSIRLTPQKLESAEYISIHIEPDLTYFRKIIGDAPLMTNVEHIKTSLKAMHVVSTHTHIKVLEAPSDTKFSGRNAGTALVKSLFKNLGNAPARTVVRRKLFMRSGYLLINLEHVYEYGKKPMAKLEDFVKFKPAK